MARPKCPVCGATTNARGEAMTARGVAIHLARMHSNAGPSTQVHSLVEKVVDQVEAEFQVRLRKQNTGAVETLDEMADRLYAMAHELRSMADSMRVEA